AIIAVAREAFLTSGFTATSMSEIAAKLGGSKGTLYNYFRSKEELFVAFMNESCEDLLDFMDHLPETAEADHSVREDLIELGVAFLSSLTRDSFVSIHRLVVSEAGRFPELGRLFYENGPARGVQRFTEYFERVIAAGRLPPNDPREVGQRLKDLVLSDVYTRRLWGVLGPQSPQALRAHVTRSVDIFLMAFG
ncbi:MAG TPA: TetR/AcrR family transcriptional regulator, partial [Caulobacteraceae bacterium]|nr:TetR/AcrR family transcriptional regulator [Caulobacteraceae bacterium]